MSGASMNSGSNGLHSYYYQQGGPQSGRPEYPRHAQQTSSSSASSYIGLVDKVPPTGTPGQQFQSPYTHGQAGQNQSRNRNATAASGTSTTMPAMGQRY